MPTGNSKLPLEGWSPSRGSSADQGGSPWLSMWARRPGTSWPFASITRMRIDELLPIALGLTVSRFDWTVKSNDGVLVATTVGEVSGGWVAATVGGVPSGEGVASGVRGARVAVGRTWVGAAVGTAGRTVGNPPCGVAGAGGIVLVGCCCTTGEGATNVGWAGWL